VSSYWDCNKVKWRGALRGHILVAKWPQQTGRNGGLYPVLRRGKTRQINPPSTRRETLRPSVIPTTCLEATLFLNQVKISTNQGTSEPKPKLFADMAWVGSSSQIQGLILKSSICHYHPFAIADSLHFRHINLTNNELNTKIWTSLSDTFTGFWNYSECC